MDFWISPRWDVAKIKHCVSGPTAPLADPMSHSDTPPLAPHAHCGCSRAFACRIEVTTLQHNHWGILAEPRLRTCYSSLALCSVVLWWSW